jgi:hypothetical protein
MMRTTSDALLMMTNDSQVQVWVVKKGYCSCCCGGGGAAAAAAAAAASQSQGGEGVAYLAEKLNNEPASCSFLPTNSKFNTYN